jgi:hypothetical protein
MVHNVKIDGFEGQNIQVQTSFWTGPKLLVNGAPAPQGRSRSDMLLRRNDGSQVNAMWKPKLMGLDVPQLIVDGRVVDVVEPLMWYQWLWAGLPIVLVFMGGALGGLTGAVAFSISTRVFRMDQNGWLKYALVGLISLLALVIYVVLAGIFVAMINR